MLGDPKQLGDAHRLSIDEKILAKAHANRPFKPFKKVVLAAQLRIHSELTGQMYRKLQYMARGLEPNEQQGQADNVGEILTVGLTISRYSMPPMWSPCR